MITIATTAKPLQGGGQRQIDAMKGDGATTLRRMAFQDTIFKTLMEAAHTNEFRVEPAQMAPRGFSEKAKTFLVSLKQEAEVSLG